MDELLHGGGGCRGAGVSDGVLGGEDGGSEDVTESPHSHSQSPHS